MITARRTAEFLLLSTSLAAMMVLSGCGKDSSDIQELGQQVGDVMASIDEAGGSGGSLAMSEMGHRAVFARLAPADVRESWIDELIAPTAYALGCHSSSTFSSCTNNQIVRTFGGCNIGSVQLDGTVSLTWSDASVDNTCQLAAVGHSITRVPSFTLTGRRGATLTVSKTGTVGQRVTVTGVNQFEFTNDGIRRVFASGGTTLMDFSTETTSAIQVTGQSRVNRILNGGNLRVTNNQSGVSCDFTPSDVRWNLNCNCPISGSWSASCSDGRSATLTMTGCGKASLSLGDESESFEFDRCYGI